MGHDIERLHHVGHVVDDMVEALALYRRMGFAMPPPAYPALAPRPGAPAEPFGAGNTHADLRSGSFVELVTHVADDAGGRIPSDATLIPLQAPPELLSTLTARITNTSATIASCLERFPGLHILFLQSPDVGAAARRLHEAGVGHAGVNTLSRPVESEAGTQLETISYLEIDSEDPAARPGSVAEGRVGVAAAADPSLLAMRTHPEHPNGAVDLVEVVLCVADTDLTAVEQRYQAYLGRSARPDGPARVFDLDGGALTLVTPEGLATLLPGERPPALPAFVAYAIAVRDITATRKLLRDNGFSPALSAAGDPYVPAAAALGAAVIFRSAPQ